MDNASGPVYVVGAAGHQGGTALHELRALDLEAHALFDERDLRGRDPRWAAEGAHAARFDDPSELERALRGAGALVIVLEDPDTGPAERLRHGQNLIDAASRAGVGHIVFAAATGPDHHRLSCDVSAETERYLGRQGVPATVLRPATFMEEVPWYWLSRFGRDLTLATPFGATNHLPLVALDDVGALVALAVTHRDDFAGRTIDVAGDTLTPLDIAARLSEALDEPVRYEEVQVEGVFVYQEASTPVHDIEWLRSVYPQLHTFSGWLEAGGGLELCRHHLGLAASPGARRAA
ncbi:MAG: NmrA family NAD(P)-binding protein [Deltaproteobacteria bacterium]